MISQRNFLAWFRSRATLLSITAYATACGAGLPGTAEPARTTTTLKRGQVQWTGEARLVQQGIDYSGKIALSALKPARNLYAIGPIEDLQGEITIWNSRPFIARVVDGKVSVDNSWSAKAPFLVYGEVRQWKTSKLSAELSMSTAAARIREQADRCGLDLKKACVFSIQGRAKHLKYHVLHNPSGLAPDGTSAPHKKAKIAFTLQNRMVDLIGFYSEAHSGIFTPENSLIHVHFKTPDGKLSGHVDDFEISAVKLKLADNRDRQ